MLMVSACASFKTADSTKTGETIANTADDTTRSTIEKGKSVTPSDSAGIPQQSGAAKAGDPGNSATVAGRDTVQTSRVIMTRISPKEPYVNIRTEPSAKSRKIAVLKGGHSIEVLETRDSWVKVQWQKGNAVKQGWMKKSFVEANYQGQ